MDITALVVSPDGTATLTRLTGLTSIQEAVGGYIEAFPIPLDTGIAVYGNEEAKLQGAERNVTAHRILDAIGWQPHPMDYPAGPLAIVGIEDSGGEDGWVEVDVPQHVLDTAERFRVPVTDNSKGLP